MTLYSWAIFAFITVLLGLYWGLPAQLGRALLTLAWLVAFLILLFGARL